MTDINRAVKLIAKGLDPFSESRPRSYPPLKTRRKRVMKIAPKKRVK